MTTAVDELLFSAAEIEIQATGKPPAVNIVAYTGGLMSVPGWGPVAIDLAGIDASAQQVGILADHDSRLSGIVEHGARRQRPFVGAGNDHSDDRRGAAGPRIGPERIPLVKWERLRRKNHWFDALYNASAAGHYSGVRLVGEDKQRKPRLTLQEMGQMDRPTARELARRVGR